MAEGPAAALNVIYFNHYGVHILPSGHSHWRPLEMYRLQPVVVEFELSP